MNTIEATVSQFTGALTYGVTDRIDVSLAVPVVRTRLALLSNATIHRIGTGSDLAVHYFRDADAIGGYGSTRQFFAEGSAAGVGDLVVRAKATVLREGSRALAVGVDLRMPTGDEQNLLGSGAVGMQPVRRVLGVDRRVRAARQRRLPVERRKPDCRRASGKRSKTTCPTSSATPSAPTCSSRRG